MTKEERKNKQNNPAGGKGSRRARSFKDLQNSMASALANDRSADFSRDEEEEETQFSYRSALRDQEELSSQHKPQQRHAPKDQLTHEWADGLTLGDLLADLWQGRRFVLMGALTGLALAGIFLLTAVPHYQARLLVSPANSMSGAEISSALADDGLSVLRYLAQRTGVTNSSDFLRFEQVYKGQAAAQILLRDEAVRNGLMADRAFVFSNAAQRWNPAILSEYIEKRVRLEPVGATAMRRLVYAHPDPRFAEYFVRRVHEQADLMIRQATRRHATERINYLQDALLQTRNPEHRRALTTLLLEQERLLMLVSIDQPFAATTIEAPAALHRPVWPDRPLALLILTAAGALAGFFAYSLRGVIAARHF